MAVLTELTIEDFENLPDALAHNHELVDGELVDVSGNTEYHISVRDCLIELLRPYVRERKLGRVLSEMEFDFGGNAHGPDVSFFSAAKAKLVDRNRRVQSFVPDLAIEIVSNNDRATAFMGKIKRYRDCGTREVWAIFIGTRQALLFSEHGDRVLHENDEFRSGLIPGFSILLKDLFDQA